MNRSAQSFYTSVALLLLLNAVVKPVWIFFIDRNIQLRTGDAAYGRYFALLNLTVVLNIVADAGLSVYANRQGAAKGVTPLIFTSLLRIKGLLLLLYTASVMLAAWVMYIPINPLLLILILLQAGTSMLVFLRSNITALQLYRADAVISIVDKLLVIAVVGAVLLLAPDDWISTTWFAAVQAVTVLLTVIITGWWLKKQLPKTASGTTTPFSIGTELKKALPFSATVLLMALVYRGPGLLVQVLHPVGDAEAGTYANGFRLLDALNMAGWLLASFLLPYLSRHAGEKNLLAVVFRQSRNALMLLAAGVTTFCMFHPAWVHALLYHHTSGGAALTLVITVGGIVGCSMVQVYGTLLTALGHIKVLAWLSGTAALLLLIAALVWIPAHGARAAAIITCAGQLLYGLALLMACAIKKLVPDDRSSWLKLIGVAAIAVAILLALRHTSPVLQMTVLLAALPACAWGTGLLHTGFFKKGLP